MQKKDINKSDLSCVLKKSLKNVSETKKALETPEPTPMTSKEALSLKVQCGLSDNQYQMIKNSAKRHNADIYPSLHDIYQEKLKCYPSNIEITEISSKTPLQDMVNHTLSQVFQISEGALESIVAECGDRSGTFYLKAGFDGASSQSIYKQKYVEHRLEDVVQGEESFFQTAIVPIRLEVEGSCVWRNEKPNSFQFCRPLHLQYQKESYDLCKRE